MSVEMLSMMTGTGNAAVQGLGGGAGGRGASTEQAASSPFAAIMRAESRPGTAVADKAASADASAAGRPVLPDAASQTAVAAVAQKGVGAGAVATTGAGKVQDPASAVAQDAAQGAPDAAATDADGIDAGTRGASALAQNLAASVGAKKGQEPAIRQNRSGTSGSESAPSATTEDGGTGAQDVGSEGAQGVSVESPTPDATADGAAAALAAATALATTAPVATTASAKPARAEGADKASKTLSATTETGNGAGQGVAAGLAVRDAAQERAVRADRAATAQAAALAAAAGADDAETVRPGEATALLSSLKAVLPRGAGNDAGAMGSDATGDAGAALTDARLSLAALTAPRLSGVATPAVSAQTQIPAQAQIQAATVATAGTSMQGADAQAAALVADSLAPQMPFAVRAAVPPVASDGSVATAQGAQGQGGDAVQAGADLSRTTPGMRSGVEHRLEGSDVSPVAVDTLALAAAPSPMAAPVAADAGLSVAQSASTAATASLAASLDQQMVDMGVSGQWIDRIAQQIATIGSNPGQGSFQIASPTLGAVRVDLAPGASGTDVRLTTETEAAQVALLKDQTRLVQDAQLAAIRLGEVRIDHVAPAAESARGDMGGQNSGSGQQAAQGQASFAQTGGQTAGGQDGQSGARQSAFAGQYSEGNAKTPFTRTVIRDSAGVEATVSTRSARVDTARYA